MVDEAQDDGRRRQTPMWAARHSPDPEGAAGRGTIARLSNWAVVLQVCTPTKSGRGSESKRMSAILVCVGAIPIDPFSLSCRTGGAAVDVVCLGECLEHIDLARGHMVGHLTMRRRIGSIDQSMRVT